MFWLQKPYFFWEYLFSSQTFFERRKSLFSLFCPFLSTILSTDDILYHAKWYQIPGFAIIKTDLQLYKICRHLSRLTQFLFLNALNNLECLIRNFGHKNWNHNLEKGGAMITEAIFYRSFTIFSIFFFLFSFNMPFVVCLIINKWIQCTFVFTSKPVHAVI